MYPCGFIQPIEKVHEVRMIFRKILRHYLSFICLFHYADTCTSGTKIMLVKLLTPQHESSQWHQTVLVVIVFHTSMN